ncbi:MAG: hypothetical protein GF353_24550, partial [Candidatus Lokiarchaeota archaeon]|nr:hypothetical protein [Candidatus Lokiarchaeota archaeon]
MPARLINEPIEVIAHFDDKGIHPLRFKWQERAYIISYVSHNNTKNNEIFFHTKTKGDDTKT